MNIKIIVKSLIFSLFFALLIGLLLSTRLYAQNWYDGDWSYRVSIKINKEQVSGEIESFPVYLDLSMMPDIFWLNVEEDGRDIVISEDDGITKLPRELVDLNVSNKKGELWFPATLSSSTNSIFFLYYGNFYGEDINSTDVWDSNYILVAHFNDFYPYSTTTERVIDSSKNNYLGRAVGGMATNTREYGEIGDAFYFDGINDYVSFTGINQNYYDFTWEFWYKRMTSTSTMYAHVGMQSCGNWNGCFTIWGHPNNLGTRLGDGTNWSELFANVGVSYIYQQAAITSDRANDIHSVYGNGQLKASKLMDNVVGSTTITSALIGYSRGSYTFYNGYFDEVRISSVVRPPEYFETQYNNIKNRNNFYSLTNSNPRILNLNTDMNAYSLDNWFLYSGENSEGGYGLDKQIALVNNENIFISEVTVNMEVDRDWQYVTADVDIDSSRSVVSNLSNAPGVTNGQHILFVPSKTEQTGVWICPEAQDLSEIYFGCSSGFFLPSNSINVSNVIIDERNYWKVSGMTGTGGLGINIFGTALTLDPGSDIKEHSQEVSMIYIANAEFSPGDKINLQWESGEGLVLSDCLSNELDADDDGTLDGSTNIVGGSYMYTFTSSSSKATTTGINLCVNVTSYKNQGSYSVTLNDDNGGFGQTLYYIAGDNEAMVLAQISPTMSLNIREVNDLNDTNVCDFGNITTNSALPNYNYLVDVESECAYGIAVGTNASNGFVVYINSDRKLDNNDSVISDLADDYIFEQGEEAYGISGIKMAKTGRNSLTGQYDQNILKMGDITNLNGSRGVIIPQIASEMFGFDGISPHGGGIDYSVYGNGSDDLTIIVHGLAIGSGTPAGFYNQTITYTLVPNF